MFHRRASTFCPARRVHTVISAAIEAKARGKIILWMVFSALLKIFLKIYTPFLAQQNETLITVNTQPI